MATTGHGHGAHGDGGATVEGPPVNNPVFERARPLILELAHEADPAVRVTLQPYHWHGDDVLDIGLSLHGHEHHLQITAERLAICERDHHILGHDIDGAVADIYRELGGHHAGDADAAGIEVSGLVQHDEPEPSATDRERSPAAIASGYAEGRTEHADTEAARAVAAAESFILEPHHEETSAPDVGAEMQAGVAALADRTPDVLRTGSHVRGHGEYDTPEAGHAPAVGATEPAMPAEDRRALDDAQALTLHILHEIAPEATARFEEYRWHGDAVLDIAVSLHGHTHHYEITADRCRVVLRDEHILEHDLVGVVDELHREGAGAEHHPGVTDAAADQAYALGGEHASATDPHHTPAAHASGVAHAGGAPVPGDLRSSARPRQTPEAEMRRDHE